MSLSFHFCRTRQRQGKDRRLCLNNTQESQMSLREQLDTKTVEDPLWIQGC